MILNMIQFKKNKSGGLCRRVQYSYRRRGGIVNAAMVGGADGPDGLDFYAPPPNARYFA
jgi:hypothetical protein